MVMRECSAAYTMFVIAEVHAFADDHGRPARLMMNAELSAAGEWRDVETTRRETERCSVAQVLEARQGTEDQCQQRQPQHDGEGDGQGS